MHAGKQERAELGRMKVVQGRIKPRSGVGMLAQAATVSGLQRQTWVSLVLHSRDPKGTPGLGIAMPIFPYLKETPKDTEVAISG